MRFLKILIPAAAAVIALGSCAVSSPDVVDHTVRGGDAVQTETGVSESTAITTSPGDISSAMLPYLGYSPEIPEHSEENIHTAPTVTASDIVEEAVTARDADEIPENGEGTADAAAEKAEPASEETTAAAKTEKAPETAPADSGIKMQAGRKTQKYQYDYQKTNGSLSILGPNLVYLGESYDFDHYYPDESERSALVWTVNGNIGTIDLNGIFTAERKGVCSLTVLDRSNGIYAALTLHVIAPGDDVDFLPLVNNIPIANKTYPLPKDYDPGLDPRAASAFMQMQTDAAKVGIKLFGISDYRSYSYQKKVYAGWKATYGADADLVSARPGHSEHQLGLAIDVNSLDYTFENTAEGKWLKEHCADYGFIIRYPSFEAKKYTGYSYEPWHIRYLGKSLAKKVTETGMSLEECLKIDSYYR